MTPLAQQAPATAPPTASLAGIAVRARAAPPAAKAGDITGRLRPQPEPAAPPAPAAAPPAIAAPAPPSPPPAEPAAAAAGIVAPPAALPPEPEPVAPPAPAAAAPATAAPAPPSPPPAEPAAAADVVAPPAAALPPEPEPVRRAPDMPAPRIEPQPPRFAAATAAPPPVRTPSPEHSAAEDLLSYWNALRRGRRMPAAVDLDRGAIAAVWPDSLLLSAAGGLGMAHVARLGDTSGAVEYTPMVTEWILSLGRRASQRGERLDLADNFPTSAGIARYRLLALPLAADDGSVAQVLCHLCRADTAARSERRNWFGT